MNFKLLVGLTPEFIAAAVSVGTLIIVVALRTMSKGNVQITLNDAVIAAIAAGLTLLISGSISKLTVGTSGLSVERTLIKAGARPVTAQVSPLPVVSIKEAQKGGLDELPSFIARRIQALDFGLGTNAYVPEISRRYMETLVRFPWFRSVVLREPDGKLFGMFDARSLFTFLTDQSSGVTFVDFVGWVNIGDGNAREQLARVPGFVPISSAVTKDSNKRDALQKMETLDSDWLPVIDANSKLVGTVERARLISSLILDVMDSLSSAAPENP
jgi:hypothetical protein